MQQQKHPTYETHFTGNRVKGYEQAEIIRTEVDGTVTRTVILVGSLMKLIEKYPRKK